MTLGILLRKELVEQWRTMRMPSLLVVFLFIGIASPASARYMPKLMEAIGGPTFAAAFPTPTILDAYAQLAKNIAQLGALVVVVISMAAVSSERDRGTLAFLLSKPVGRGAFLAGKLAGLGATIALGMLAAAVAAYLYTGLLFAPPGPAFGLLCFASFLCLLVFATITLAASVITGSAVAAGGTGLGALVIFGVVSMLPNVGVYTPAGAVTRAVEVVSGAGADSLIAPLLAQVAFVAVAFAAALATFRHQEI
jgi:ABC-2 type transport system permease protein